MQKYDGQLLRKFEIPLEGIAFANVTVTVRNFTNNNISNLYSDSNGTIPKANPFVTDSNGYYSFYANDGKYLINFSNGAPTLEITLNDIYMSTNDTVKNILRKATLDLDFINNIHKSYEPYGLTSKALNSIVSTVRATSGTYNTPYGIALSSTNVARINYNSETGQASGLLNEELKTNLAAYSEDFSNSYWLKRGGSIIIPNVLTAPDRSLTADRHESSDLVNNGSYIRRNNPTSLDNTIHTFSFFTKRGSRAESRLRAYSRAGIANQAAVTYNHDTGAITTQNLGLNMSLTAGVIKYPDGWVRIWLTCNMLTGSDVTGIEFIPCVWFLPATIGAEYGYIWGAQIEVGQLTSYIPTTTTTLSRNSDQNSVNLPVSTEGTIICVAKGIGPVSGINQVIFTFYDGTTNNRVILRRNQTTGKTSYIVISEGNISAQTESFTKNKDQRNTYAISWKTNMFLSAEDGVLILNDNSGNSPIGMNKLIIGSNGFSTDSLNGEVERIIYIPFALSAAELLAITSVDLRKVSIF